MTNVIKRPLYVPYAGPTLLEMPLLNKGSALAKQAQADGFAPESSDDKIRQKIDRNAWYPRYRSCRRAAF